MIGLRRTLLTHAWLQAALWVAIVLVLNHLSSSWFARWDITASQRYSLSPEALPILAKIKRPLIARVMFSEELQYPYNNHRQAVIEKLEELRAYSRSLMDIEVVVPELNDDGRAEAREYGIEPIPYRFRSRDVFEARDVYMGVALLYGDRQVAVNPLNNLDLLEYELLRAIHSLVSEADHRPTIGVLQGDGEPDLRQFPDTNPLGRLKAELERSYDLALVTLGGDEGVPDKVDVLMIMGPQQKVSDRAQYQIDQFLMNGGSLAFFGGSIRPDFRSMRAVELRHDLNALLGHYGVQLNKDAVIDRKNNEVFKVPVSSGGRQRLVEINYPLIPKTAAWSPTSPITKNLDPAVVPFASTLQLADPLPQGVEATPLLHTDPTATAVKSLRYVSPEVFKLPTPGEVTGPFLLGAALNGRFSSYFADKPIPPPVGLENVAPEDATDKLVDGAPARIVAVASQDFVANNPKFVLNAFDWLAQDIALVSIRTKAASVDELRPPDRSTALLYKTGVLLVPLGLLGLLGAVVLVRQRRSS